MSAIVSDTSPINYLLLIGEIELLPKLFTEVLIPEAVFQELSHSRAPKIVAQWISALPAWAKVTALKSPALELGLDAGETEAISLAVELGIPAILVDERRRRVAALKQGVVAVGTLNVLEASDLRGLVEFEQAIDRLRNTTFHVDDSLLDKLVQDSKRRNSLQPPQNL